MHHLHLLYVYTKVSQCLKKIFAVIKPFLVPFLNYPYVSKKTPIFVNHSFKNQITFVCCHATYKMHEYHEICLFNTLISIKSMSKEAWLLISFEFFMAILFMTLVVYGDNQRHILRSDYGCKFLIIVI